MDKSDSSQEKLPSQLIDERISELNDWRGKTLEKMRQLIKEADPDVIEEWKWVKPSSPGTPVWSHNGGICTGEVYKSVVKFTFFKGASLEDPAHLFNQPGTVRRAINLLEEGKEINSEAFKALIQAAVKINTSKLCK
jgi:hypothetical protein